jgi:hypothetical protein
MTPAAAVKATRAVVKDTMMGKLEQELEKCAWVDMGKPLLFSILYTFYSILAP